MRDLNSNSRPPRVLAALALVVLLAGCVARITVPETPPQPRPVSVLDHGRHTSVILFDEASRPWRYAYGDWGWYVDGDRGALAAARALLLPSQAALGRALLVEEDAGWQPQVGSEIRSERRFQAKADLVDSLLAQLNGHFEAAPSAIVHAPDLQLDVVPHPQPYTFWHNSNHKVAEWLRALGAEVRGSPAIGAWRFDEP